MPPPSYAGPRSLRQLLDAVITVGSDLDLEAVLRHIVESAVALVDARYGALGVLDETGTSLSQFLTVGMDDETYRAIGPLPSGHGILGLLILDPKPIRLPDLREHPDSYGFPPNHPPMKSFLGVPIPGARQVFGNLYLTDKTTAEVFTDVDEELVVALAAAAGVAIENARLHTRVRELALLELAARRGEEHDVVAEEGEVDGEGGGQRLVGDDHPAHRSRGQEVEGFGARKDFQAVAVPMHGASVDAGSCEDQGQRSHRRGSPSRPPQPPFASTRQGRWRGR